MQVNAPFQKLKVSLLLILQMLLIAMLGFALARPYLSLDGHTGKKQVMLIDTSASMATLDAGPSGKVMRLEAAKTDAFKKIDDLREGDEMALASFDSEVRQLAVFTSNKAALKQAVAMLKTRDVDTDATHAFELGLALIEAHPNGEALVLTDGCFGAVKLKGIQEGAQRGNTEDLLDKGAAAIASHDITRRLRDFRFISYGTQSDNVAITQMDLRSRPVRVLLDDGTRGERLETQVLVMVENFAPPVIKDGKEVPRDIVLGVSLENQRFAPKVLQLKGRAEKEVSARETAATTSTADASRSVEVFKLPLGSSGIVTARIEAPRDKFPVDDVAYAVISDTEGAQVLLVSKGNFFLEKALSSLRGATVSKLTPDAFNKEWEGGSQKFQEKFDVVVFDGVAPLSWTDGGALFLGALPPAPGFSKHTDKPEMEFPPIVDWDTVHPVMRYVNFGNVTVAKAQRWVVPKTARTLIEGRRQPAGRGVRERPAARRRRGVRCLLHRLGVPAVAAALHPELRAVAGAGQSPPPPDRPAHRPAAGGPAAGCGKRQIRPPRRGARSGELKR